MNLEGLHHVTAITGDAPRNVDFYSRVLGLRMVKKTVNFDDPDVYHLYFGDEIGTPGSILTFFEFPGAARGRAGDGTIHTIQWRVRDEAALDFWAQRLDGAVREEGLVHFDDPEGLTHEFRPTGSARVCPAVDVPDAPLVAPHPDIPDGYALRGFHGVRAYASDPARSAQLLEALGFAGEGADWRATGAKRSGHLTYDAPPAERAIPGAGTVHHVAWSAADDAELEAFSGRARDGGARPTPIIDRQYFHSVYFREPSGVLFELASRDIGFAVDEPRETLGEALKLPPQYEHLRSQLEQTLTPLGV